MVNYKSLQQPYEGPFKVVAKDRKWFKIEKDNEIVTVPFDRIKPAITENIVQNTNINTKTIPKPKHVTFNLLNIDLFRRGSIVGT